MSGPPLLDGRSILVAEDDASNLDVVTQMLTKLGAAVTTARNGITAVERIRRDRPEIVLLDIEMPEMSGLDVLREIGRDSTPPTVICLTAHVDQDYLNRVLELGAKGTIGKPLRSIERLGQRILEIHNGLRDALDVPVLDLTVFDMLTRALGADMVGSLVDQLGTDLEKCNAALVHAVRSKSLKDVRTQTHILTGVAGSVGASRLAVLAGQLNSAAHGEDIIALRSTVPQLRVEIDALLLEMAER